ncbi:MAG: 50S ribosomal protein L13 [bacterium]|nr:50S ribosomal protein L13 [bacterium]
MEKTLRKVHVIDATEQTVGRLASQIARLLQGKHKVSYVPNADVGDSIEVTNIGKLRFTGRKLEKRVYYRHSGYLGGLKTTPMSRVFEEKPEDVLRHAVKQMLPKNRLTPARLKRLKFKK